MQISSKELFNLIVILSAIFLIAPLFMMIFIFAYNKRKKRHAEEKKLLQRNFEHELLRTRMEVREQTLQTVAADLHDNIGQLLSLTRVTLSSIDPADPAKTKDKVNTAEQLTSRSIRELRQLSHLLYGHELPGQRLEAAISAELEWLNKSGSYELFWEPRGIITDPRAKDKEIILFRLFQEILNNVIKHAGASQIRVKLSQEPGGLSLSVADNGCGFDVKEAVKKADGMGLQNIARRTELIGGKALFDSVSGEGTTIIIHLAYL
ncbi:Signal transduction histidine kinase [Mucilaginibacter mallensis]|uniref:Oxygen sensor histidine kinase NreB n=1 Tax=Mucilaginibacter mallensis TaxID=652787 RepID=A0A1H2BED3_MUCMA|nr:ATP-binding protein [Mucilaginibacter mallensis]SDT56249.1 Signal transduction histidine kinase [Mucilaginibacter mallensis]